MVGRESITIFLTLALLSSCAKKPDFPEPVIRRLRGLSSDWNKSMSIAATACGTPRYEADCRKYAKSGELLEEEIVRLAKQYPGIEEQEPWIKIHLEAKSH